MSALDRALALVHRRRWLWAPQVYITCLGTMLFVLGIGAFCHFIYLGSPPEYYVRTHGSASTARMVSLFAIPTLAFLILRGAQMVLRSRNALFARFRFAWALNRAFSAEHVVR